MSTLHALGPDDLEFVRMPPRCMTFSRAVRRGRELDLSDSDSYNRLVVPLLKATLFSSGLAQEIQRGIAICTSSCLLVF
jgi:hypothetical protein